MISTAFKPDDEINSRHADLVLAPSDAPALPDAMARPYFWDVVKNSLIVGRASCALDGRGFLAAVALAKYRFTGHKLFVVL
jgi:ABC-type Fe3+ transport system permease subunit